MQKTDNHAVAQATHDLGSALWFGGAVMGVVGVNKSGSDLTQGIDRIRVAKAAWGRFAPIEWAGIGAATLAGLQLTRTGIGRITLQRNFGGVSALKAVTMALGVAATAYAGYCGAKIASLAERANDEGARVEVKDATVPTSDTPARIADWQRRQQVVQYAVPALAGANIAFGAYLSQSYRPGATVKGVLRRLRPD